MEARGYFRESTSNVIEYSINECNHRTRPGKYEKYGNGVPGVLKNALDWLVSTTVFMNKPTAVISASPSPMGGDKAHASLLLTLTMINAKIVDRAALIIPYITMKMNKAGTITDSELKQELLSVLLELEQACFVKREEA